MIPSEQNAYKRAWFWRKVKELCQERFRFIDEAGVNFGMTRLYGRAKPGERVTEKVPKNYGAQTTIISSLGFGGVQATLVVEGAVDTLVFNSYVENILRPTIKEGETLVLDNLSSHRASCIEQVAQECGAKVLWLSPYSPDFSPIELMWSKLKSFLRKARARTEEELFAALSEGLQMITTDDCLGWFKHCGYLVASNC